LKRGPWGDGAVVVASLESDDGFRCVDIVRAADGLYLFDEWRRDPEDPSGWHLVFANADKRYSDEASARAAAAAATAWLPA
jgi:hypothetical protein